MSTLDTFEPSLQLTPHPPTTPASTPALDRSHPGPIDHSEVYRLKRKLILPREEKALLPTGRRVKVPVYRGLPNRCVCCGALVDEGDASIGGCRIRRLVTWHHSAIYLTLLLCVFGVLPGLLLYGIIAVCCQEKAIVWLPLCRRHLLRRKLGQCMTYGLLGGTVVLLVASIAFQSQALLAGMGGGVLLSILWAIPGSALILVVRADRIDHRGVVLRGASRKFLDTLPERRRGESELQPPRQPPMAHAA